MATARHGVLQAGANLRRALLFFTPEEVRLAAADLEAAHAEVVKAKDEVTEVKARLREAKKASSDARQYLQNILSK